MIPTFLRFLLFFHNKHSLVWLVASLPTWKKESAVLTSLQVLCEHVGVFLSVLVNIPQGVCAFACDVTCACAFGLISRLGCVRASVSTRPQARAFHTVRARVAMHMPVHVYGHPENSSFVGTGVIRICALTFCLFKHDMRCSCARASSE